MTKNSLILFMQRILEFGSEEKSKVSLKQLKEILIMQNADAALVDLVAQALSSFPEVKEAARDPAFTEESLQIGIRRATFRKFRVTEMVYRGRC